MEEKTTGNSTYPKMRFVGNRAVTVLISFTADRNEIASKRYLRVAAKRCA